MGISNKGRVRNAIIAVAIVVAGLVVRGAFGAGKRTYHIDEGYSAALTNGGWVPGMDPARHDAWLDSGALFSECFSDRLAAAGHPDFKAITDATARDVHPPLYYWVFAIARTALGAANFSFAGYALNMLLFAISCALVAFIAWRAWRDWPPLFLALAIFAFSSTSISLTIFIRMYELLQTICLAFLACALVVVSPPAGKGKDAAVAGGVAGLFALSFLGLMTQYYFLFFVAPVALVAAGFLVARKRPATILWSLLAVAAGLYLAYRVFPPMFFHLTKSYRAEQSLGNLAKMAVPGRFANLRAYLGIVGTNLVPWVAVLAVVVLAVVERARSARAPAKRDGEGSAREGAVAKAAPREAGELPLFVASLAVFAFTFAVVSLSAPYQTARYVGAFFPVYAFAFIGFARLALSRRAAIAVVGAVALLGFVHGVNPRNACEFHEDYSLGENTAFMLDSKPVILMTTPEGGSWKNMLPYLNFAKGKKIYVANEGFGAPLYDVIREIARGSGEREVYAIVDDYFKRQPAFEQIGYYGFYFVYRVKVE